MSAVKKNLRKPRPTLNTPVEYITNKKPKMMNVMTIAPKTIPGYSSSTMADNVPNATPSHIA